MTTYSEKLKHPKWQKKRLEIMERDKFKCKLCGDEETMLQIHHKEYVNGNDPWDYEDRELITLCEHCHIEIERCKAEEFDFKEINIYKSNTWSDGGRIMFVSHRDTCSMIIYDSNNKYDVGFNLSNDIPNIIKILKRTQRYGL